MERHNSAFGNMNAARLHHCGPRWFTGKSVKNNVLWLSMHLEVAPAYSSRSRWISPTFLAETIVKRLEVAGQLPSAPSCGASCELYASKPRRAELPVTAWLQLWPARIHSFLKSPLQLSATRTLHFHRVDVDLHTQWLRRHYSLHVECCTFSSILLESESFYWRECFPKNTQVEKEQRYMGWLNICVRDCLDNRGCKSAALWGPVAKPKFDLEQELPFVSKVGFALLSRQRRNYRHIKLRLTRVTDLTVLHTCIIETKQASKILVKKKEKHHDLHWKKSTTITTKLTPIWVFTGSPERTEQNYGQIS